MEWVTTTQILQALKTSGEEKAWQQLYECFRPVLASLGRRAGLSEADAEDAVQEALTAFCVAFREGRYDRQKGRLSHWLFGIARNTVLKHRSRLPPEHPAPDAPGGTSFWERAEAEDVLEQRWTAEWEQMVLTRCLTRAKAEFRPKTFRAFELSTLRETPVEEISRQLNMSPNAVYIAKNRVLTRLRELEHEFDDLSEG